MRTLKAKSDMLPHLEDEEYQQLKRDRAAVTRRLLEQGPGHSNFKNLVRYANHLDDQIALRKQECLEEATLASHDITDRQAVLA